MNLYPDQLRQIADMCEALDKAMTSGSPAEGMEVLLPSHIVVADHDEVPLAVIADEIGGAYSLLAQDPPEDPS